MYEPNLTSSVEIVYMGKKMNNFVTDDYESMFSVVLFVGGREGKKVVD